MNTKDPHDSFFKYLMAKPSNAADLIQQALPPEILNHLDLKNLQPAKESFTSKDGKHHFADIIFQTSFQNQKPVLITILLEHKSYKDELVVFQVLNYMINVWRQLKNHQKLTPIIPIVFYHGKHNWAFKQLADLFEDFPDPLKTYLPNFHLEFINLHEKTDEQILNDFEQLDMQSGSLLMKHIFGDQKSILELIRKVLRLIHQKSLENDSLEPSEMIHLQDSLLAYSTNAGHFEENEIINIFVEIQKEMITFSEFVKQQGKAEGKLEGRLEGRLEGKLEGKLEGLKESEAIAEAREAIAKRKIALLMLQEGMPIEQISKFTGLTTEEIKELETSGLA